MRLATRAQDSWQLDSGEERHRATPDSFWIPPLKDRQNLQTGQLAKLLFEIEGEDEQGTIDVWTERMWVLVTEHVGEFYVGILSNQPFRVEPGDTFYLQHGSEIAFLAEHVIDIDVPSPELLANVLALGPRRRWPRDGAAA
jgi:hypothetical protein